LKSLFKTNVYNRQLGSTLGMAEEECSF